MKKLLFAAALIFGVGECFAQEVKMPQVEEIASVEQSDESSVDFFNMPSEDGDHYYLCVGSLGAGNEVIQVLFDPVFKLFIPLGSSLDEATETLGKMQALFKQPVDSFIEMPGCLAFAFPNEKLETVKITHRRPILTRKMEFSLEREGYIRATYVDKSDIGAIASSAKFYKKLHPQK